MANKKFFISTLSAILFCLFFCLACFFPQGFTQGGTIDYLITLIASFCLFFWGITMVYRTQYKKQRIILLCIFVISFLWISIRFVKWLANMHFISIYADYFYYIPMTVIPLLFFILVAETFCTKFKHKKVIYSILISIVLTFIILAFSNNLHNLIYKNYNFSYSETNPNIEIITYDYNYMHFAMLGFILLLNISTISLFFWGTAKQITFKQIFISSLFIVLLFVYILLYTFNTWHIKNIIILKDFALVVVIFLNAILETLLEVGLIQNNGRYEQNFKNSNLPMCIFDENEKILFVSKKFENSNNKHLKQKTKNIGAYKLVVQEDLTELDNLQQKIKTENKELESINQMLEKLIKINSEQSKLAHKLAYIDEIEHGIGKTKKELETLIFSLPEKITQQNKKTTQQKLGNIALHLGYMKQKCMLILGAKEKQFLSFDAFNLIMQVITKDIKSVGFDNIAYKITKSSQISFDFAQKVNDFVFCIAKVYKFCNADAIIFVDPSKKSCSIELDAKDIQIKKIKINGLNISFSKQDNNFIRLFMEVKNV